MNRGGGVWDWEADFSSASGWTTSNMTIDTTDEEIDPCDTIGNSTDHYAYYDMLGTTVSNTAWVFDMDWNIISYTNSGASNKRLAGGIGSLAGGSATQDGCVLILDAKSGSTNSGTLNGVNGNVLWSTTGGTVFETPQPTGVNYLRMIRQSATQLDIERFTTQARTTSAAGPTTDTIDSTVVDLRYAKVSDRNIGTGGDIITEMELMRFADGVTTPP